MRKTTKILSLLLTLAMMLTMAVPMTVSAAFTDVPANHQYYDAVTNLSAEGILNGFEDGSFKPGDPVTRAQFTKIICYALSVGDLTYSEEERSIFTDLQPDHWAANNIVTAYKQGIINGMGDGTFAPEAGVQYEQAVKMVVCALGYSQTRADALGGYPGGYMSLANQAKLLKGITDAKMYEVMNRGAVAQLIDNMLDAEQIQDGQPSGSLREEVSTSKKVEGQVVAGYGVALYDDAELNACRKNEILVKLGATPVAFDISELNGFDIYEYLGRNVTIYYEEESGVSVDVASSIALQPRKNETIKINLDMIYDYDTSSIEYYTDDERTETEIVNYQTSAYVLWNGQPVTNTVKNLLDSYGAKSGYITLVSSGSNTAADVVFLKTYDTMVVYTVDTKNYKVSGKNIYKDGIVLDVTDRNKKVTIKQNGSDFALSSIRENHILSISKSADDKVIEVLVSTKTASGTVESASGLITSVTPNVPEEFKLNTGNTIYTVSPEVHASSDSALEVGKHVTINLDAFGKVARYIVTAESAYNYGYISSLEEKNSVSTPEIRVMIYKPQTSNSTLTGQIYQFADRVKINGTNYNVEDRKDDILSLLLASANTFNANTNHDPLGESGKYAQPIKYTLNGNKINAILIGDEVSAPASDNTTRFNIINKATGIACTVDGSTFGQYRVSSSTPVIYIPADRATGTYSSKTNNLFEAGKTYYAQFAGTSTAGVVGCVYLYGVQGGSSLNATITDENKPLIVKSKGTVLYKDVETTKMELIDVTAGEDAAPIVCYEDATDIDFLEVGDVVRVAIGADEYVEDVEVLADSSSVVAGTFNYNGNYWYIGEGETTDDVTADFRVLLATIYTKGSGTLLVTPGYTASSTGNESVVVSDSIPVYKIDTAASENLRIETGSMIDVVKNSNVLIYTVEGIAKAIIIFE